MTEKQKMLSGELYYAMDDELVAERLVTQSRLVRLNGAFDPNERRVLFQGLLGSMGEDVEIRSPFFCDYGYNIHLGRGVFLNFDCVFLDVMPIHIGEGTQIGPGVQIYAADHPREHDIRRSGHECGKMVTIGKDVWIGGGAIVLPGITIADDCIVGAGAVVTRDVRRGETVVGNPARPR